MKKFYFLMAFFALSISSAAFANPTQFEILKDEFKNSQPARLEDIKEVTTGRCVRYDDPNYLAPAVLFKMKPESNELKAIPMGVIAFPGKADSNYFNGWSKEEILNFYNRTNSPPLKYAPLFTSLSVENGDLCTSSESLNAKLILRKSEYYGLTAIAVALKDNKKLKKGQIFQSCYYAYEAN